MTTSTTTKPMTAEEFHAWVHLPENADRWFELERGEVVELLPPKKPHGVVCMNAGRLLANYAFEHGFGYVACNDSGVILAREPDTVRGPDVAVYNDASTFSELHPKYAEVPPLLAVEVLSPDDRAQKVLRTISDYLRAGVRLVWVVDPETRQVTVHQPSRSQYVVDAQGELTGEEVLPGFRCQAADLFRLPGEKAKPA